MPNNTDAKFINMAHAASHIMATKIFKYKPNMPKVTNYCGCQTCVVKLGWDAVVRKAHHSNRTTMRVVKRRVSKIRRLNDEIIIRDALAIMA